MPNTSTWYTGGDRGMAVSTNDGASWTSITPSTWADVHGIAVPASLPQTVLTCGRYGQVWYSANGGQ